METDFRFDPHDGSDMLVVAFTSYGADDAPPGSFEWQGVLRKLPVHRLFLKDRQQLWYLNGIEGFGSGLGGIAESALAIAKGRGIRRIFTLGASMGGFVALTIGRHMQAHSAITFGAIASARIDSPVREGDLRCLPKLRQIRDLGLGFEISRPYEVSPFVNYYDPDMVFERRHAELLAPLRRGDQFTVPGAGHNPAEYLARKGVLAGLVEDAIFPSPGRHAALLAWTAMAAAA